MNPTSSTNPSTPEEERLLRLPDTLSMVGLGRTTWLDLVRDKAAPQPVKLGRSTLWLKTEVQAWVRAQIKSHRNAR